MSDLIRAIRVNEEIKRVLDASREIRIVALNAALTARQAGPRSVGFAVVSRELRALAGRLETCMGALDEVITQLAADLAHSVRERRQLRYIESAAGESQSHSAIAPALEASRLRHDAVEAAVVRGWHSLEKDIRSVLRIAETGGALARSAKIEAAYGGEMARILTGVAEEVATAIDNIRARLVNIGRITESEGGRA